MYHYKTIIFYYFINGSILIKNVYLLNIIGVITGMLIAILMTNKMGNTQNKRSSK